MAVPEYVLKTSTDILDHLLPLFRRYPSTIADQDLLASMRRDLEAMIADTRKAIRSATFAEDLAAIVDAFRASSGDQRGVVCVLQAVVNEIRLWELQEARSGIGATVGRDNDRALLGLFEALTLAAMAEAVRDVDLVSHGDALALRKQMVANFDTARDRASDRGDVLTMRDLQATLALVVRDLIERGRPLHRVSNYSVGASLPAVVLAHLFYQDAARASELFAENETDSPAFMPLEGTALL